MNAFKGIAKYYIGVVVLVVFAAGLVGYTIASGSDAKTDKKTTEKANAVAMKLDSQISMDGKIPENLDALGVKDIPPTVTYKKISDEKYKFCVTYKSAGSAFDAGLFSLFGGALYGGALSAGAESYEPSEGYLDSYYLIYNHKKGENCQTVKPYGTGGYYGKDVSGLGLSDDSVTDFGSSSSTPAPQYTPVCSSQSSGFTGYGIGIISAVDGTGRSITVTEETAGKSTTVEFDEITKAYDKSCAEIKIATLKAGDKIKFYGYAEASLVDVIELQ